MIKRGKKYKSLIKKYIQKKTYFLLDGCKLIKKLSIAKFDESVDLSINLCVDLKKDDHIINGFTVLPYGSGKKMCIAVFAKGSDILAAKKAGANLVGAENLSEIIKKGKVKIDKVISSFNMMHVVGKLGKYLGPKGLMPNLKMGTVTSDVAQSILDIKKGKIEFKADKNGIINISIGRVSFVQEKLFLNVRALFKSIILKKPVSLRGQYIKKIVLSTTMGPSISLDVTNVLSTVLKV